MGELKMKTIPSFGYEIIRDHLLHSILGKHEEDVLYWAGKELARKFPLFSSEELPSFFTEAGWGVITLEKESKDEAHYVLTTTEEHSLNIEQRCFRLEAGFLAEQIQKQLGCLTECYEEKIEKKNYVRFTLKWDLKELV
ncbi:YslB family protein [Solibacillus daqui]|uniref:YslB family protein n=1 Tax=Solibacillus daqui TaxID=2912187 RepID=UPI0023665CCB|nr:YslB family protein [Solibacillus daqui]